MTVTLRPDNQDTIELSDFCEFVDKNYKSLNVEAMIALAPMFKSLANNRNLLQNIVLKEFGFRLYDGLIDYSFDQESNIFDRVDGLVKNLNKLKFEDLNELYNT